jgi:hypothetical protein
MAKTSFKVDKNKDYYRLVQRVPYEIWHAINVRYSEARKSGKHMSKEQWIMEDIFKPYLSVK